MQPTARRGAKLPQPSRDRPLHRGGFRPVVKISGCKQTARRAATASHFATNESGIFAGTYFGNGVFRSTDDGDSWNERNDGLIATKVRTIATQGPIPRMHSPSIDAADFVFAGTYGRGVFRSTDSAQNWQQINNGLLALYESALVIRNGYIFVGADFVNGAGGVYRSADYGDSWLEINHNVIKTDVRALATSNGHIFAGTYFGGGVSDRRTMATAGRR